MMAVFLRIDHCNHGGVIMRRIIDTDGDSLDWYDDTVATWAEGNTEDLVTTINTLSGEILDEPVEVEPNEPVEVEPKKK